MTRTPRSTTGRCPGSGVVNKVAFEEEIADVWAQLQCCINELGLDKQSISERVARKVAWMAKWEEAVNDGKGSSTQV